MLTTLALFILSLVALSVSMFAAYVSRRTSARSLSKRLDELLSRCSEVETSLEVVSGQLKNLRARLNMQAYRKRRDQEESEDSSTPSETGTHSTEITEDERARARARMNQLIGG